MDYFAQQLSRTDKVRTQRSPTDFSPSTASTVGSMSPHTAQLGESKIIEHFRPRLFKDIDKAQTSLKLDLFWPIPINNSTEDGPAVDDHDSDDDTSCRHAFPYDGLEPLRTFRSLRVLQISGMMQSYQPLIWQAVWANENLAVLHLEMALPPLFNKDSKHPNRLMDSSWSCFPSLPSRVSISSTTLPSLHEDQEIEQFYLGENGSGYLHEDFGCGEYFDTIAIKRALLAANDNKALDGRYRRFLGIRELTLMNFVVDGSAFENWFDSTKLKKISFQGECIDAGFYLHESMSSVSIQVPSSNTRAITIARSIPSRDLPYERHTVVPSQDLKMISIRNAKITSQISIGTQRRTLTASPANSKRSYMLKDIKAAIKGRFARGKENKLADESRSSSSGLNDSSRSSSFVKVSPADISVNGAAGCFGGAAGFESMETLFNSVEIRDEKGLQKAAG